MSDNDYGRLNQLSTQHKTLFERIAQRVPVGSYVRGRSTIRFRSIDNYTWYCAKDKQGIVLRHYHEREGSYGTVDIREGLLCQFEDEMNPRETPPRLIEYLIDGQWQTFEEIMK